MKALMVAAVAGGCLFAANSMMAQANSTNPDPGAGTQVVRIRPNVYVLVGAGENIAIQVGSDGVVLVNAGTAASAPEVLSAVRQITHQPIRFIIDTSADAEAVGGNAALAKAGRSIYMMGAEFAGPTEGGPGGASLRGATVLSTSNVLLGMAAPQKNAKPFPYSDWPTDALTAPPYFIYFNHGAIRLYPESAHDATDTIVLFQRADVIAAGDIIDADRFPMIDVSHGGSIQGEIAALNHILRLSDTSLPFAWRNAGTEIIPAHGHVYLQADVARYRDMLIEIRDSVQSMIKRRMTLQQIEAASPCLAYRNEYGREAGSWTTSDFIKAVYQSLTGKH